MDNTKEMKPETQKLIDGLGGMAEALGFFYGELTKSGFSPENAFTLCNTYLASLPHYNKLF